MTKSYSHTALPAFYTVACCLLPVVWVNSGVACYITVGIAATSPRWGEGPSVDLPVTVAVAALGCYVITGGRGVPSIARIRHNMIQKTKSKTAKTSGIIFKTGPKIWFCQQNWERNAGWLRRWWADSFSEKVQTSKSLRWNGWWWGGGWRKRREGEG
jgi:hypothetical protein